MTTSINFKPLFDAAASAGSANAKVGTEVGKLLKSKRRSQADSIKTAGYAEFLGERKARDLSDADARTYAAMRQGFSRYYSKMGWNKSNKGESKSGDGFALQLSRNVKPETVVKSIKTLAEYLRTEFKDERMLQLAAFLADIE